MNKYVIKVGLTGSGVGQERNGRRFRGVLSIGGKVKAAYHKVVPQKAGATFVEDPIVLSQEDRDARDEDLAHYKKALGYAGQQSPAHDYDFCRGWEYMLGRWKNAYWKPCLHNPGREK